MCIVLPFLIHSNGFPFCQALEFWYYCMFFNTSFGFLSSVLVRYDFDCECVWRKWTKFQIEHIGWIKMMCCMRVCWLALIKIKKIHRHFASELNYFIFGMALAEIVILVHWRTILSGYNSCHHNSFHNVFRWAATTALPSPIWMNDWTNEQCTTEIRSTKCNFLCSFNEPDTTLNFHHMEYTECRFLPRAQCEWTRIPHDTNYTTTPRTEESERMKKNR